MFSLLFPDRHLVLERLLRLSGSFIAIYEFKEE